MAKHPTHTVSSPSSSISITNPPVARRTTVTRATPFNNLPDWLSRCEVQAYVGISKSSTDGLIHNLPRRFFGKHLRISKYLFKPPEGTP